MCGIAGIHSSSGQPIDRASLEALACAVHHRGPDESGRFFGPGVGLAIERLQVIDLLTGSQPVFNETKDVVTIFNGEIYNYKELRQELEGKGHTFYTRTDTEVIVHLYEEHGEDFSNRLNGMFAIALWDQTKKKLLLIRDRAGIKPLFYSQQGDRFLFASEIKALLADPKFPRDIDAEAFENYLSFYYVCAPRTIYKHIRRLPAGHMLVMEKGSFRIKRYWDLSFQADENVSLDGYKKEFNTVLDRAVKRHLQSDVPVGVFLSGGLDSAGITAVVSRYSSRIQTYTIGYEESSYSELTEAKSVADLFKTNHHEFVMKAAEMTEYLPEVVRQMDEPHGDWSAVPNYLLSKYAKKDVTVVLNGAGGDELFGGYPTLIAARYADYYRRLPSWMRTGVIEPLAHALPASHQRMGLDFLVKSFVRGAGFPVEEAHRRFKEIFNDVERQKLLTPGVLAHLKEDVPARVFEDYREQFKSFNTMDRLLYLDFKVFLAHCPLYVQDITTSAHAVEGRVPFLDQEMIDFSSRVPFKYKIDGFTTKRLMREAMGDLLPERITRMKKKGFLIPGALWIKKELRPMILDIIAQSKKELSWVFDFSYVNALLDDHFSERADNTRKISCLVSFFLWHKTANPVWGEDFDGIRKRS